MSKPSDFVQGTLDVLCCLKILALRAVAWVGGESAVEGLFSVMCCRSVRGRYTRHCQAGGGWVDYGGMKPTENNRRAKFYSLTRAGRKAPRGAGRRLGAPVECGVAGIAA